MPKPRTKQRPELGSPVIYNSTYFLWPQHLAVHTLKWKHHWKISIPEETEFTQRVVLAQV